MVKVGLAAADISGCGWDDIPFRMPLEASCLGLGLVDGPFLVFSLDMMDLFPSQDDDLRGRIGRTLGCSDRRIVIHTTHSHTTPWGLDMTAARMDSLTNVLVGCVSRALEQAQPARIRCGRSEVPCRLSINRRAEAGGGLGVQTFWYGYQYRAGDDRPDASALANEMQNRWLGRPGRYEPQLEPVWFDGPVDPWVHAIAFEALDGKPIGSLVRFSAHPHLASCSGRRFYDPDFPGVVRRMMAKELGVPCMFLQGTDGNLVPAERVKYVLHPTRHGGQPDGVYMGATASLVATNDDELFAEMDRIGSTIAQTAIKGLNRDASSPLHIAAARHERGSFDVNRNMPLTQSEVVRMRRCLAAEVLAFRRIGGPLSELRRLANQINSVDYVGYWVEHVLPKEGDKIELPISAVRLGDAILAFMPCEVMADTTFELRKEFADAHFWTVGHSGGYGGYLPTQKMIDEGGYEGRQTAIGYDSEPQMRREVSRLLRKLR